MHWRYCCIFIYDKCRWFSCYIIFRIIVYTSLLSNKYSYDFLHCIIYNIIIKKSCNSHRWYFYKRINSWEHWTVLNLCIAWLILKFHELVLYAVLSPSVAANCHISYLKRDLHPQISLFWWKWPLRKASAVRFRGLSCPKSGRPLCSTPVCAPSIRSLQWFFWLRKMSFRTMASCWEPRNCSYLIFSFKEFHKVLFMGPIR